MTAIPIPQHCPVCDAADVRVVEDVSDEVTIFGCGSCGRTFADRADRKPRAEGDQQRDRTADAVERDGGQR
jgi:transposase-like protein